MNPLVALCYAATLFAAQPAKLQFINGGAEPIEVFRINGQNDRAIAGKVPPGERLVIDSEIGARYAIFEDAGRKETAVTCLVPIQGVWYDPIAKQGVPAFYAQSASAHGYPIVASATVNPYALKEAAWLIDRMLEHRPDVREAMIRSGSRLCIEAPSEFTTDLPEFAWLATTHDSPMPTLAPKDYWDRRARGLGGDEADPYCSVGEENLLGYPGDPYAAESILVHEFAHNIHLRGILNVDPTFDARLKQTFEAAIKAGLWNGKYASVNCQEYFAEGAQSWFDDNRVNDHDHNHVHLRSQLKDYDPGLAALCAEVFGDRAWRYSKPLTRLSGHLQGYDPSRAPKFAWPARLEHAGKLIQQAAKDRDERANRK